MEISLLWVLPIYGLLVLIALVVCLINIFHIVRFGSFDQRNRIFAGALFLVMVFVLVTSIVYGISVDWSQPIEIGIPSVTLPTVPTP